MGPRNKTAGILAVLAAALAAIGCSVVTSSADPGCAEAVSAITQPGGWNALTLAAPLQKAFRDTKDSTVQSQLQIALLSLQDYNDFGGQPAENNVTLALNGVLRSCGEGA